MLGVLRVVMGLSGAGVSLCSTFSSAFAACLAVSQQRGSRAGGAGSAGWDKGQGRGHSVTPCPSLGQI